MVGLGSGDAVSVAVARGVSDGVDGAGVGVGLPLIQALRMPISMDRSSEVARRCALERMSQLYHSGGNAVE